MTLTKDSTPAEVRAEWAAALRSGDYAQTRGTLLRDEGNGPAYCCLGVLCDLAEQAGLATKYRFDPINAPDEWGYKDSGGATGVGVPPIGVIHWAAMTTTQGALSVNPTSLTDANDVEHMTLSEIADLVESDLLTD